MRFSDTIHRALRGFGFDYVRFTPGTHSLARRLQILKTFNIDLVLDVGANRGQYGLDLRELGYRGKIVSFEPLPDAYALLAKIAQADGAWQTFPYALGAQTGTSILNVAANSESSSLLEPLPLHLDYAPASKTIQQASVPLYALDTLFGALARDAQNIFLKIDTQGSEDRVLDGAAQSLTRIATLQLEMSLVPLYRDAPLFQPIIARLTSQGYELVSLEPGSTHSKTGRLLQVDGIFHRYESTK